MTCLTCGSPVPCCQGLRPRWDERTQMVAKVTGLGVFCDTSLLLKLGGPDLGGPDLGWLAMGLLGLLSNAGEQLGHAGPIHRLLGE